MLIKIDFHGSIYITSGDVFCYEYRVAEGAAFEYYENHSEGYYRFKIKDTRKMVHLYENGEKLKRKRVEGYLKISLPRKTGISIKGSGYLDISDVTMKKAEVDFKGVVVMSRVAFEESNNFRVNGQIMAQNITVTSMGLSLDAATYSGCISAVRWPNAGTVTPEVVTIGCDASPFEGDGDDLDRKEDNYALSESLGVIWTTSSGETSPHRLGLIATGNVTFT